MLKKLADSGDRTVDKSYKMETPLWIKISINGVNVIR